MTELRGFSFAPTDWVYITFCNVNYRGRVTECIWQNGCDSYQIEYVNDSGEMKEGRFLSDELSGEGIPKSPYIPG